MRSSYRNRGDYVRTFACGKEKWTSLRTELLSVGRNRMKEHIEAAERERAHGRTVSADGKMSFGAALVIYRRRLKEAVVRPNTRAFRESGVKVLLGTWEGIEESSVRRITPESVCRWLKDLTETARPHGPPGAKSPSRNSTRASASTIKSALDAARLVLEFKATRRQRAERGPAHVPTGEQFSGLVGAIGDSGVPNARASADFLSFMAFSGACKTEAANAAWADVDFDRGNIRLRMTKSGEGRTVPMFPEMRELLIRMKQERGDVAPDNPVLPVREAQGFINSACKRLGIPRFTHHALRAMFGTTCLEAGIDVRTVAEWLGHKDHGALLLKTYSHVRAEHEREMVTKVTFGMPASPSAPAPAAT